MDRKIVKVRKARRNDPDGYDRMSLRSRFNAKPAGYEIREGDRKIGTIEPYYRTQWVVRFVDFEFDTFYCNTFAVAKKIALTK